MSVTNKMKRKMKTSNKQRKQTKSKQKVLEIPKPKDKFGFPIWFTALLIVFIITIL